MDDVIKYAFYCILIYACKTYIYNIQQKQKKRQYLFKIKQNFGYKI